MADVTMIEVPVMRAPLLRAAAALTDEAFEYFVVWARGMTIQFPNGLGGFTPESQETIHALRRAAGARR